VAFQRLYVNKLNTSGISIGLSNLMPGTRGAFTPATRRPHIQSANHFSKAVVGASTCIQHMQKALTGMNIQLANVISDISGMTGMAILRAIVNGERNPQALARMKNERIHASRKERSIDAPGCI